MYLIDSNIWLELLLKQEKSDTVAEMLRNTQIDLLCASQ